jgi:hypothetical protein
VNIPHKRMKRGLEMNAKLAKWVGRSVLKQNSGNTRGSGPREDLVLLTKNTEGGKSTVVRISLHARLVKQAGLMHGDKISLNISPDGAIVLDRVSEGKSSSLCRACGSGKTSTRLYLRFPVVSEFFDAVDSGTGKNVEAAPGRIAFDL